VRKRLEAVGVEVYAMNLTRSAFGIPVVRTLAPNLELGQSSPPGKRLRSLIKRSGADPDNPAVV